MANTVIQLKWSDVTSTPTSLNVGEAAYSNTSNKLFIGDTAGNVLTIGGRFYVDQQGQIFTKTNVAFDTANSAASYANAAFTAANTGGSGATYANGAFAVANSAASYANSSFRHANGAFSTANSAASAASSAQGTADTALTAAGVAQSSADAASSYANSAFATANTGAGASSYANSGFAVANSAASYANSGFAVANSASVYANSAYVRANNSINANTGGTITADLVITGNLTVQGNTTYVNTQTITTQDSLIRLANNNTIGDTVDIGLYGAYNPGSGVKYTGLVRQAGANYFLFQNLTTDPTSNVLAPGSLTAANTGTLTANLTSYAVSINGIDVETNQTRIFTQANSAFTTANSAGVYGNSAFAAANTADAKAVTSGSYANSAFARANNSLDTTTGGSISGSIGVTGNVYAGNVIANSGFTSTGGTSKLSLSDIGIVSIDVAGEQFKFQASGIESSKGIFGGSFGGNKLSLNSETNLISNRGDVVKIQTGTDGTTVNDFVFSNNSLTVPGGITANGFTAGGINVVPTLAATRNTANAAFAQANTDVTNISISAADYGSASAVAAFRVEANGRISSANSTAIAIAASAITSGTLGVARGGSGAGTFTTNAVLLGNGTSAFNTASSSTEGHLLTINASGVPTFSHLQGGTF